MPTTERTTVRSLVTLPAGWLPVVVASGSGAALLGLASAWIGLVTAGVTPGGSEVARWTVGGPISAVEGAIWFLFDAHWVRIRTGPGLGTTIFGRPLVQADAALWPLRGVVAVIGVAGAGAVRYLGTTDPLTGAVTGAGTALGYLPTMLALRWISRVPLTRHAADGAVPISDADGIPVSQATGVSAGPDLVAALVLVTGLSVTVGGLAGAAAAVAAGD
ncbi:MULTISPECIES: hypothetical protein [Halorubrum]|uniref:DUF7978 domain-containing protein n=1 Tax=Halorubrum sodomense TaxID=35743 RepID=A0A1I6H2G9_HALSD|nr:MULTISPECIES: hypothetical protein [Halorubrum]TKX54958.1 hypothetical protein EXE42_05510 [Halorubrum sp. SP3]TKX71592.1 hypothetical protein EXE45_01650 [Halorubrum sp. SP9]SFR48695.1 hypothetical protein SAMN04487937_2368 [Halorubrum sodomense]